MLRKCIKNILFIFLFGAILTPTDRLLGQDIQFSQFYAASTYLNPAFAGSAHNNRLILHQRFQWPGLEAKYTTSMASVDMYFRRMNSGFGLMVLRDWQGSNANTGNRIMTTEVHAQYAYEMHINSYLSFRGGLQGGYVNRTNDYSSAVFSGELDAFGNYAPINSIPLGANVNYFEIGSGGILYTSNFWVSYASHHMNTPNQTIFPTGDGHLPVKHAFTTGYKYVFESDSKGVSHGHGHVKEIAIIPTFHYKFQGKSDQFDAGVYGIYDQFLAGIWYRGIPVKHFQSGLQNNESIIILMGFKLPGLLEFRYSYDFVVSRLAPTKHGGAHEFNLTLLWPTQHMAKKKHPTKRLPCPRFTH